MFYIVNESEKEFKLAVFESGHIGLIPRFVADLEEVPEISLFNMTESLRKKAKNKIENEPEGFVVRPHRTTKFFVSDQSRVTLYKQTGEINSNAKYDLRCGTIVSVEKGLHPSEYRHPKSIVIIITAKEDEISLDEEVVSSEKVVIERMNISTNTDDLGVKFHAIACGHAKWDLIPENVYITLPSEEKLLYTTATKERDGKEIVINALVRFDKYGDVIERKPRRRNNDGQKNHKGGHKKGKRGKRSDIIKDLPLYNN